MVSGWFGQMEMTRSDRMIKITSGFNLYQPWCTAVVEGKIPILLRSQNTKKRERVAVIANEGIDGTFLFSLNDNELTIAEKMFVFSSIIGSVIVDKVIKCEESGIIELLKKIAGEKAFNFYPKHFLPFSKEHKDVYIWILKDPIKISNPIPFQTKGISWSRLKLTKEQNEILSTHTIIKMPSFWDDLSERGLK